MSANAPVRPQNVGRYLDTIRRRLDALEGSLRMEMRAVRDVEQVDQESANAKDLQTVHRLIDAAAYSLQVAGGFLANIRARGPQCGHSHCSQNYIDTGDTDCVPLLNPQSDADVAGDPRS